MQLPSGARGVFYVYQSDRYCYVYMAMCISQIGIFYVYQSDRYCYVHMSMCISQIGIFYVHQSGIFYVH